MLQRFMSFIRDEKLFHPNDRILLAVSGGMDSMVMLHLFNSAGYRFGVAHCNFNLRGDESDEDAAFVRSMADNCRCEYHEKVFDTLKYAGGKGYSVQMAARELRYEWFEELVGFHDYKAYATAHHQDDQVESFLINLSRGTGIAGLTGMPTRSSRRIRPLLFAGRKEIEAYQQAENIQFREDSSNQELKYQRNKIRHQIIPLFEELNPSFTDKIIQTMGQLSHVEAVFNEYINQFREQFVETYGEGRIRIPLQKLFTHDHPEALLFALLRPFNFNASVVDDIFDTREQPAGKMFYSPTHRLLLDRGSLIIEPLKTDQTSNEIYHVDPWTKGIDHPICMVFSKLPARELEIDPDTNAAFLDHDLLEFPLVVRRWKEGDFFYPLGMTGRKKISDFLIDMKVPVFEKERIWLLCSGDKVVWVIGIRIDNRFKLTSTTRNVLRVKIDRQR